MMSNLETSTPRGPTEHDPNYWEALFQYVSNSYQEEPMISEFALLQRLNLTHLANELARVNALVRHNRTTSQPQMECLRQLLHRYTDAIRDYQYISQYELLTPTLAMHQRDQLEKAFPDIAKLLAGLSGHTPYSTRYLSLRTSQGTDAFRELLSKVLPKQISWTDEEKRVRATDYYHGARPEIYSPLLIGIARLVLGVAGACLLVAPMMIMVVDSSLTKSLVTVSVAVVAFALMLTLGRFDMDVKDVLSITATYAAVLVVFVGTSISS